ncbi:MAG: SPOR domain-containing protein [Cellvibrionaceae bacterium]
MKAVLVMLVAVNVILLAWGIVGGGEKEINPAVTKKTPLAGEQLVLLRELGAEEMPALRKMTGIADSGESEDPLCIFIGAFNSEEKSRQVVERLSAWDIKSTAEDVEVPVGKGYWVYLAPEVSRPAAMRKLKELQARNLDSYVIPRGNLEHGISFGVFSSEARAVALQDRVIAEGYGALLAEIERTEKQRWVVVPAEMAAFINDMVWGKVLEIEGAIEREKRYCLGVAPEENIQ